jgi:hypothetical protein
MRYTSRAKEKAYYEKRNRRIELSAAARKSGAKYVETRDAYGNIRRTLAGGDKELTERANKASAPSKKPWAVGPKGPETKAEFRARVSSDMDASRKAAAKSLGRPWPPERSPEPNLKHLAKENKIPAKVADVPAGGKGAFDRDAAYVEALLKPVNPEGLDKDTLQWKRAAKAGNIDRVLEQHAEGRISLNPKTVEKLKTAAAGFRDSDHPRHPAGTSKGGEFAPKGGRKK